MSPSAAPIPRHQRFLIEDLMPEHEVHLIAGPSGAGKTIFTEQILIKPYLAGLPVFGKATRPRGVAYVSCDRSQDSFYRSLDRQGISYDAFPFLISGPSSGTIKELYDALNWCHSDHPTSHLLVIEGFGSLVPGSKTSDYGAVAKFLHECRRLCEKWDLTLLGSLHATKVKDSEKISNPRQRILGSVAWAGFADLILVIDEEDPEDKANRNRILHVLPRDHERFVIKYSMDSKGHLLSLDDQLEADLGSILDVELAKLPFDQEFSTRDLLNMAFRVSVSRPSTYRWIDETLESGRLERVSRGNYRRVREV